MIWNPNAPPQKANKPLYHNANTIAAATMLGILGATVTVLVTTLDDAIWLVPYVGSPSLSISTRCCHAMIFIATLEGLSLACVGAALVLSKSGALFVFHKSDGGNSSSNNINNDISSLHEQQEQESMVLGIIGAVLCWTIAIGLWIKKMCKRMKRQRLQQQKLLLQQEDVHVEESTMDDTTSSHNDAQQQPPVASYGAVKIHNDQDDGVEVEDHIEPVNFNDDDDHQRQIPLHPSPWTVISFTTLGALDEISYFPALVVGQVFSPLDLCVGTFLAACLVVFIVTWFLQPFQPLMAWLDRIPLYGIVGMFATVLTLNVVWDAMNK